jgi:hypothetical protein
MVHHIPKLSGDKGLLIDRWRNIGFTNQLCSKMESGISEPERVKITG